jgi:hypothetical protein
VSRFISPHRPPFAGINGEAGRELTELSKSLLWGQQRAVGQTRSLPGRDDETAVPAGLIQTADVGEAIRRDLTCRQSLRFIIGVYFDASEWFQVNSLTGDVDGQAPTHSRDIDLLDRHRLIELITPCDLASIDAEDLNQIRLKAGIFEVP